MDFVLFVLKRLFLLQKVSENKKCTQKPRGKQELRWRQKWGNNSYKILGKLNCISAYPMEGFYSRSVEIMRFVASQLGNLLK